MSEPNGMATEGKLPAFAAIFLAFSTFTSACGQSTLETAGAWSSIISAVVVIVGAIAWLMSKSLRRPRLVIATKVRQTST